MDRKVSFSVVIPVRNGAEFIRSTLESIARQTYRDFEAIVIDDGSTDDTAKIVKAFAETDGRFRLGANAGGKGHEYARNLGVSLSNGEWIAVCDADDLWREDKLSRQAEFLESWDQEIPLVMIGTAARLINEKGDVIGSLGAAGPTSCEEYLDIKEKNELFMLNHSSVVYERRAFLAVGGYRLDYTGAENVELNARMAEIGAIVCLDEPLFMYRKHLGSFMLANTRSQEINFHRIKENNVRRRQGQDELSYEQFLVLFQQRMRSSGLRRFNRNVKGKFLYRKGAIHSANGRLLPGLFFLSLAGFYDFRMVWSGLRRRVSH